MLREKVITRFCKYSFKDEYVKINVHFLSLYKSIPCLVITISCYCFCYIKMGTIFGTSYISLRRQHYRKLGRNIDQRWCFTFSFKGVVECLYISN